MEITVDGELLLSLKWLFEDCLNCTSFLSKIAVFVSSSTLLLFLCLLTESLLWVRTCLVRSSDRAKHLKHISQVYGFSPVCVLICVRLWSDRMKVLSQYGHTKAFIPICIFSCRRNSSFLVKRLKHFGQEKLFSTFELTAFFTLNFVLFSALSLDWLYICCSWRSSWVLFSVSIGFEE